MKKNVPVQPCRVRIVCWLVAVLSCAAPFTRTAVCAAIEPPAADAPAKPVEVGSISVASLEQLSKLAKTIGVDLPPFLTAPGIGQQFPFLGPDGLDPDAPIGIVLYSAPDYVVSRGQGMIFVLPVKPGAAPLSGFSDAGGKPVAGSNDAVELNGATFRRTEHDLMFSPTQEAVIALASHELPDLYKPRDREGNAPLGRFVFDLAAFRKIDPDRFKASLDQIRQNAGAPKDDAERFGQDFVYNFIDNLGRVDLSLGETHAGLEISLGVAPAHTPKASSFPRPGMPSSVIARLDMTASPLKMVASFDDLVKMAAANVPVHNAPHGTPEEQRQLLELFHALPPVFLDGQAVSVGLEPNEQSGTFYIVQQKPAADLATRLQRATDKFKTACDLLNQPGDQTSISADHYALADGLAVTRTEILHNGAAVLYLDAAEKEGIDYLTVSNDDHKRLESLVTLSPAGKTSALAHVDVDLERTVAAMEKLPGNRLATMTEDQRKIVEDVVRGHKIAFSATGNGDSILFSTVIPQSLVAKIVTLVQQGPQNAAP